MAKKIKINISEEPHCKALESLGSIFKPLIKDFVSAEDFIEVDILLNWQYIIGGQIAAYCFPRKAKFNPRDNTRTLFVEVPAGGYALEMQHREEYMLEKINAYFGYKAIHKLNIAQNVKLQPRLPAEKKSNKQEMTEKEKQQLKELMQGVEDEKLKEILTKLGESIILSNRRENDAKND